MTRDETIIEAYKFGAGHGWIWVYVAERADGSFWWSHAASPEIPEPGSDWEIIWSMTFSEPQDLGEPTESDWAEWLLVNAP